MPLRAYFFLFLLCTPPPFFRLHSEKKTIRCYNQNWAEIVGLFSFRHLQILKFLLQRWGFLMETNRFGIYISTRYVSFVLSLFLTLYFVAENNNTSPTVGTVTNFYGTVK